MEDRSNGHGSRVAETGVSGLTLGFMVGVIAGGIAVLLYAPKSGREMREMLKDELNETQCMFQNWSNDLNERVNRFGEIVRFKAEPGQISSKM